MIDFHCHILPTVDDGAEDLEISLSMLRVSFCQGVDLMVATSHFYADEEYPSDFLNRRSRAFRALEDAMFLSAEIYPRVVPGAEVLYFPGISQAEAVPSLTIGSSNAILIEPPMVPWSDDMLDEIRSLRDHFGCEPIIAHVDRYMSVLNDTSLIDRVLERNMKVQVNASYFLDPKSQKRAFGNLQAGKIHLLGSDCHNLNTRPPNLALAHRPARLFGMESEFKKLHQNAADLLLGNGGKL